MLESVAFNLSFTISVIFFVFGIYKGYKFGCAELENFNQLYSLNNYNLNFEQSINFMILIHILSIGLIHWITSFVITYSLVYIYFAVI